ncbi:phage gp6-like head-tail connector protein [Spirosoma endbachense]|uniref:Phage gp6-like head-tail connector protein n=1 Tax=Spirosoma endbachense TaxID=2666025 RepID=A0A6P1W1B0_9BACT|nr:phage gp6-like head-tail connector protein [Spirosoma endbachense]QHV99221.1 hypothetical protein GJR95_31280 [Spirosoma endbachense]
MLTARLKKPAVPFEPCIDGATACDWIRIDRDSVADKGQAVSLVQAAMDWAESFCKQPLFARDYYGYGDDFCPAQLHSLNVQTVSAIHYQQDTADWVELPPTAYRWHETGEIQFLPVACQIRGVTRIRVSYRAGYESTELPADILQVVRLLIGRWYDNRADDRKQWRSHAEWIMDKYVLPIL